MYLASESDSETEENQNLQRSPYWVQEMLHEYSSDESEEDDEWKLQSLDIVNACQDIVFNAEMASEENDDNKLDKESEEEEDNNQENATEIRTRPVRQAALRANENISAFFTRRQERKALEKSQKEEFEK